MTTTRPNWNFINNEADLTQGWNDAGVETFRGSQVPSLTREIIQNSIDAVNNEKRPVRVRFSLAHDVNFGQRQLATTFNRCWQAMSEIETERTLAFFKQGAPELELNRQIPTLVIEDFNTTGLADNRWKFLLKATGIGAKPRTDALGSYGIGKNATFAASRYRTVLYSTQFTTPTSVVRKFQGKSILVSHLDEQGNPKGAIGYYGGDDWQELTELDRQFGIIPDEFRRYDAGTSIYLVGFDVVAGWRRQLISSVLTNFFYAILTNKLVVDVEGAQQEGLPERISKETIASALDTLVSDTSAEDSIAETKSLFETIALTHVSTSSIREFTSDGQLQYLGHTKVWIRVGEGMPNKALIIRDPGMTICDAVRSFPYLKRIRSHWGDFAAVVVCVDREGNELLRSMEPPTHDGFEPDRLKGVGNESAASKGQKALEELGRRIRDWIDLQMPKLEDNDVATLDDLADFFPSEGLDTASNPTGEETDPFGNSIVGEAATKLPVVRKSTTPSDTDGEEVVTTDAEGEEQRFSEQSSAGGGGNGNPNQNHGPGSRAKGPRGSISGLRMTNENGHFFVTFTPDESFNGKLIIAVASEEKRSEDYVEITRLIDQDGFVTESSNVKLESGKRVRFAVQTRAPLPEGHAVNVEAVKELPQ